ncbi:nuclear transport factor 2 family protein [Prauserella cavernicola]|uniref:Nuclear transport factor 2 family protein n=1 Tax=Prauserella cavernicola TaxID=2800127 RepID=A0A934QU82_9PSEU|nr:nuclear transport factor 2 family protein [Prauserella cavernicola]MBK1786590.1 nuclear transport factor 2 family protein [Prauserella cavernicola]
MPARAPHEVQSADLIAAQASVVRTCVRAAWLADRRDWPGLHDVFAEYIDFDYTSLHGGEPLRMTRDELVRGWRTALSGLDATQHLTGNHLAEVDGDSAVCTASVLATHVLANDEGEPTWTIGGHYRYALVREDGTWRIGGLTLTAEWTSGNPDLMLLATRYLPDELVQSWQDR